MNTVKGAGEQLTESARMLHEILNPPGATPDAGAHDLSYGATPKADGGGLRYNAEKNRLDLLPIEWSLAIGEVMTAGAKKYAARNWERGMSWSIMVGCSLRHLYKFMSGERYDPETGCHHLAHCAWNILALMSYDVREIGTNDLAHYAVINPTKVDVAA